MKKKDLDTLESLLRDLINQKENSLKEFFESAIKSQLSNVESALNFTTKQVDDLATVSELKVQLTKLEREIGTLKSEVNKKDARIAELEKRLDNQEQYSRKNDVVVTGLRIKPRSFASAVASGTQQGELSNKESEAVAESVEQQLVGFLNSKGVEVKVGDIEACHPLPMSVKTKHRLKEAGKKVGPDPIILRFINRKSKLSLMKQWKLLRGSDVYLNDHLTKANSDLAMKARQLRRDSKIKNTWTRDCNVYIQTNGSPDTSIIRVIRSEADLRQFMDKR